MKRVQLYGGPFDGDYVEIPDFRPVYNVSCVDKSSMDTHIGNVKLKVAVYILRYINKKPRYEFSRMEGPLE